MSNRTCSKGYLGGNHRILLETYHFEINLLLILYRGYNKTLKRNKEKTFDAGTKKFEKHKYAKTTLGIADLRTAVKCPEDELLNDWLAVHGKPQ